MATTYHANSSQTGNVSTTQDPTLIPGTGVNKGIIINPLVNYNAQPIAHTFIDGVDIWDGHLTVSNDDINVPGRGPDLDFTRTYASNSGTIDGPLGAGWTDNYHSTMVQNDDGSYTVIMNGTGNTFAGPGKPAPAQAAQFGVPAALQGQALFFQPQIGYHSVLIQPDPSRQMFEYFSLDHTLYDFELQRELQPFDKTYTLRYIVDPNGNKTTLYYSQSDPGFGSLPDTLKQAIDIDPTTLDVITDSSGRALILTYERVSDTTTITYEDSSSSQIVDSSTTVTNNFDRIIEIKGFNPQPLNDTDTSQGSLDGLDIVYKYDDGDHNLTSVVHKDQLGNTLAEQTYHYTPGTGANSHRMVSSTDPNGNVTSYTYDVGSSQTLQLNGAATPDAKLAPFFAVPGAERISKVEQPGGVSDSRPAVTIFTYANATTRTVSDPRGAGYAPTVYTLDGYGAVTRIQAPEGQNTTQVWAIDHPDPGAVPRTDNSGRDIVLLSRTDALGETTSYKYDKLGNVISQTISSFASGYAPVTQSNGTGIVSSVTTSFTYDPLFDTMTSATDANNVTTYFVYDSPAEIVPTNVNVQINVAKPTGNLLATVDGMGFVTYYEYAAVTAYNGTYGPGDLKDVIDPNLNRTDYLKYDAYGNPISIRNAVGDIRTQVFDARSRLTQQTATGGIDVSYRYDGMDRVTSVTQSDDLYHATPQKVQFTYYAGGQLQTEINGLGQVTSYTYDSGNRLTRESEQNVKQVDGSTVDLTTQYSYDEAGNMAGEVDARGVITSYTYDGLDRLKDTVVLSGPAATPTQTTVARAAYDVVGNKISDTDLHGNTTLYTYDGLYREVASTLPVSADPLGGESAVIRTGYDLAGNEISQSDADGNTTTYTYDRDDRLMSTLDPQHNMVTCSYDKNGNMSGETDVSTGLSIVYGLYDGLNRPSSMTEFVRQGGPGSSSSTYVTTYGYDDSTNTVTTTDPNGNVTVRVSDGLGRLRSETVDPNSGDGGGVGAVAVSSGQFQTEGMNPPHLNLTTAYTYDGDGNVTSITDPAGTPTSYTYDGLDRLIQIDYAHTPDDTVPNVSEKYFYDGDNNVTRSIDKRGVVTISTYDNFNRVVDQQLVESISNHGATLTMAHYAYTDTGPNQTYTVEMTDANHNVTRTVYDALGRPLVVTDPLHFTTTSTYDGVNQRSQVDANGNETDYTYDKDNRLVLAQEYDGTATGTPQTTTRVIYDDINNQVHTFDRDNIETIDQYDSLGRLTQESAKDPAMEAYYSPSGGEVVLQKTSYDGDNNVTMTIAGNGTHTTTTRYDYDAANRRVDRIDGYGSSVQATTNYNYDKSGNLLSVSDPRRGNATKTYTYDARNRMITDTDGANDKTIYTHDANDNVTGVTDPKGNVTKYTYDELDMLLSVDETASGGGVTYYVYDGNRNKIAQQDPDGNLVIYAYDARNLLSDTYQNLTSGGVGGGTTRGDIKPSSGTNSLHWHFEYDGDGNETKVVDPQNQITSMTYDYLDRLATVQYLSAAMPTLDYQPLSVIYGYDGNGNLLSVIEKKLVNGGVVSEGTTYSYDKLNQVRTATNYDNETVSYTYDAQGSETSITYPDGSTVIYQYDARERLSTVQTPAGSTQYAYFPDSLLKSVQYPNGVVADSSYDNSYDGANRLTYVVNHTGQVGSPLTESSLISSFSYSYDADGNRMSQVELQHGGATITTGYGYDGLNRLTTVAYSTGGSLIYTYDNAGNRLTEIGTDPSNPGQAVNLTYKYDTINRLMSVTNSLDPSQNVSYTYDNNGNRTSEIVKGKTTRYAYNILDELVKTTDTSGGPVGYDYDYSGMRIKTIDSTGQTRDLYGPDGKLLLQYSAGGLVLAEYTYGINLISLANGDSTAQLEAPSFYSYDALGSSSDLTDANGNVQMSYQYDAWGNVIGTTGASSNTIQFTGQIADAQTGLDYFGARYYDPIAGRFLTQDKYLGSGRMPVTLNRYAYASANPLRYVDRTGQEGSPINQEHPNKSDAASLTVDEYKALYSAKNNDVADGTMGMGVCWDDLWYPMTSQCPTRFVVEIPSYPRHEDIYGRTFNDHQAEQAQLRVWWT